MSRNRLAIFSLIVLSVSFFSAASAAEYPPFDQVVSGYKKFEVK
ncbi:MAG: hypothetical protein AAF483_20900 [Planctomycetota bacterium]